MNKNYKIFVFFGVLSLSVLGLTNTASSQMNPSSTTDKPSSETDMSEKAKMNPMNPAFKATLISPEKEAREASATVKVTVTGETLIDPTATNEMPKPNQAHIHYQLDNGPVIATTATTLGFHQLTPGDHNIVVYMAANDHSPLSQPQTLHVVIPENAKGMMNK